MPAFKRHGFTVSAVAGSVTADVVFVRPDVIAGDGLVQQPAYVIEYVHADMPALVAGTAITVDGVAYTVRGHPRRSGDGHFAVAELTKA